MMFLDSPDKILSLGRSEVNSLDSILSLGRFQIVSPDKSSCPGPEEHDSPDNVSSPDEQSELGSYTSFVSVNWTLLVTLDFNSTLTSWAVWVAMD